MLRYLVLTMCLVSSGAVWASSDLEALQWPSGKGVCTGPYVFKMYKACSGAVLAKGQSPGEMGHCGNVRKEDISDVTCPLVDSTKRCHKLEGHNPEVSIKFAITPCDGKCNDDLCREKEGEFRSAKSLPADSIVTFVRGSLGERGDLGDEVASVIRSGRGGRKTQICEYKVQTPKYVEGTCPTKIHSTCKINYSFSQECRQQVCGVEDIRKSSSYGWSVDQIKEQYKGQIALSSLECSTCDGAPELNISDARDLSPKWVADKVYCLVTQINKFRKIEDSQRRTGSQASVGRVQGALQKMMDVLEEIQRIQDQHPQLQIPRDLQVQVDGILNPAPL